MAQGFWGRVLTVDLTSGKMGEQVLTEDVYRRHLGGYGLGAHILFQAMAPGVDPLGPENVLGFVPGLLTGSGAPFSGRFMVVGKSPLTGGWGESNCGGDFGPALRGCGFDGLFVRGHSDRPVYLYVEAGHAEIRDAGGLWGLDALETGEAIRRATAADVKVACIGPAGEQCSLLAAIVSDDARVAARTGLAAVMGSKRLKAVAVRGKARPVLAEYDAFRGATAPYLALFRRRSSRWAERIPVILLRLLPAVRRLQGRLSGGPTGMVIDSYRLYGTSAGVATLIELGDTPVRNWLGIGYRDFPLSLSEGLSDRQVVRHRVRAYACHACPVACGATVRLPDGTTGRKPEYEGLTAFGPLVMNSSLEVVMRCCELCNRAGMDVISVGVTAAFAMECFERGWLPPAIRAELPLHWGDGEALLELVQRIAERRPGLGEWLADGVARAARSLGPEAQQAAMHVGGQELSMHRGLYEPGVALGYALDPAPGRHTASLSGIAEIPAYAPYFALRGVKSAPRYDYAAKGAAFAVVLPVLRAFDSLGLCHFALQMGIPPFLAWLNAATGWRVDEAEFFRIGWRIQVLRHAFNAREGLPTVFGLPGRERGDPPQPMGPLRDRTLDVEAMARGYFDTMGLDPATGWPLEHTARELSLELLLQRSCAFGEEER